MNTIKIYYALTENITQGALEKGLAIIPEWRGTAVMKNKNFSDKINGVFVYLLLQKLTESEFGVTDTSPFKYGERGKPYFSKCPLFFSMSHSKCAVGAAVSDFEVGFDITDNRSIRAELAEKICSASELSNYDRSNDKQRFLRQLWCKKESLVKRTGEGFSKGFTDIDTVNEIFYVYDTEKYCMAANWENGERTVEIKEIGWQEMI